MIVVDTTVLAYAVGGEHPLRDASRRFVAAVTRGALRATTTVEVIQELAHIFSRRRSRAEAASLARDYADMLSPLLAFDARSLDHGLALFEAHPGLGCFDAFLAATALAADVEALVSADAGFAGISGLDHVVPGTEAFDRLVPA